MQLSSIQDEPLLFKFPPGIKPIIINVIAVITIVTTKVIKMILIIFIGIILIVSGIFLIIYYGFNPKFKVKETVVVSKDGNKRVTIIEGTNIPIDNPDELIEERKTKKANKKKTKQNKKAITHNENGDGDKNELTTID